MRTSRDFKRTISEIILGFFVFSTIVPAPTAYAASNDDKVVYPLKEISKLECRFSDFKDLKSSCKETLPVLKTKDYRKYATQGWGYNKYTRLYTVLWWASYKYGWDVWHGGHIWTDIATAKWTPVYSIAKWKVIRAKKDNMLWNFVTIEHKIRGKKVFSNYAHLSKINVKVWTSVHAGTKIWEVWSTWNSTWNHLHFQIDLDTPFHPYYYDYKACPFSYYKITEDGVCYDELDKNTIDPLLFLETGGKILDDFSSKKVKKKASNLIAREDLSIFDRTVYIWYSASDIVKVQEIYKKLGYYKGDINGKYEDLESSVIKYQIAKWVIKNKSEYGAGRFGPKTRFTTKRDYLEYLDSGSKETTVEVVEKKTTKAQKIERASLMSREEIEKKEVEDFLKYNNVELYFNGSNGNIWKDTTETLKLKITTKKGRNFKWVMPGWMTFVVNSDLVSVFPQKLFYFTDWKRDIKLSWLKEGNTNLYVKIGNEVIKTIPLKIYKSGEAIYPQSSKIISPSKITIWDSATGIALMKDWAGKSLINIQYGSTFKLKASEGNKVCLKTGSIKNVKRIYTSKCGEDEYKDEIDFDFSDTVWGLVIFDYKAKTKNLNVQVINNYNNKVLSKKTVAVSNPKGLNKNYAYTNEVMDMLEKWVVNWIKKGYFLEKRWLTQRDAFTWTQNALYAMKADVYDSESKQEIENNLAKIKKALPYSSRTKTITRQDFLDLTNTYLVLDKHYSNWYVEYKDVDSVTSNKLAKVFDKDTTWKDKFGDTHFRPEAKITRWEWAFFIAKTLEKSAQAYLTLR